jgi:NitT/TauT family transport system ATP-binding protein/nitrate/nitrite transport system substrate-binding protein
MSISLGGNAITLSNGLADPILEGGRPGPGEAGRRFRQGLDSSSRPTLAVVHGWSTHDLLLRYWLSASGIDPERDLRLTVIPPAEMPSALAAGEIDGFCAGAPWGAVAASQGLGRTIAVTSEIWRRHPEKCLAVRRDWSEGQPVALQAMLRAILRAGRRCDDPEAAPEIAALLAKPAYLDLAEATILGSLPGGTNPDADRSIFHAHAATYPFISQARWFLTQSARWRELPVDFDAARVAGTVYRPDLYAPAARVLGLPLPDAASKTEGGHAIAWTLPASPMPISMGPDAFFDGAIFPA